MIASVVFSLFFFFSSRRRHTRSVSAFLLNRSSDLHSFPKFFACLVRFESSSVPTTLPTAYDVYPLDGRHDGGYYTVKDCVTIDVLPRTPGNNRSEERRVGKECRERSLWDHCRKKM